MPNPSKFHSNLVQALSAPSAESLTPGIAPGKVAIIVRWKNDKSAQASVAAATATGTPEARHTYSLFPGSAHHATRKEIEALSDRDDVELIWHDQVVKTCLDVSVPLIGAPMVWQAGYTGKGIRVAVVDTGIDPNHPDFAGRIAGMTDFTGEGTADNMGHGTHVAGIIGGTGAASGGKYKGVAPECTFLSAKVLGGNGSGSTSDVIAGIEWGVQQGAQVMNLSLGSNGPCDGSDSLSVACDSAMARGVVMCIAAGNAGPAGSTVGSPGCARQVITVGATDKMDQIAFFSSRGPTADGRVKPDLCFPGYSIVACRASGTNIGGVVNNFYTTLSGTSMATPHCAGSAALLLQKFPTFTPQQIKDDLMGTTKNLGLDPNTQGTGRANVYQAALFRTIKSTSFAPTTVNPDETVNIQITVFNGSDQTLQTQGTNPGFAYEEGDTFYTRGFPDVPGAFRVGIDFISRTGIDHPYRWGLGAPLGPGQTATIHGSIRLKIPQQQKFWAGLVQEQVGWVSDHQGTTTLTVLVQNPIPAGTVTLAGATIVPATMVVGNYLVVAVRVVNNSSLTIPTQGPPSGYIYEEGDTFETLGFSAKTGNLRVGVDFEGRTGIDHPYRWGLTAPLGPGQSAFITGAVHLLKPGTRKYWAGLVQEYVQWLQDQQGAQTVVVKPGPTITGVSFSPTTLASGTLLNVSVTVRNDGDATIQTGGPNPGFSYTESDTFISRGFPSTSGAYRIGVDFDGRSGIDHPYRWGLGAPLAPGQSTTITGSIMLKTTQSQNYWVGLVQEQIAWIADRQGTQNITVTG